MSDSPVVVHDHPEQSSYVATVDGAAAGVAQYVGAPGRRIFTHTKVEDQWEGKGVGSALARGALDDTRAQGLTVVARCPFIREYIERHPEYQDLLAG